MPQLLSTVTGLPVPKPNRRQASPIKKTKAQIKADEKKMMAMAAEDDLVYSVQQFVEESDDPQPISKTKARKLLMNEAALRAGQTGEDKLHCLQGVTRRMAEAANSC